MSDYITKDQIQELKSKIEMSNIKVTQVIELHNQSDFDKKEYSLIYRYDEETINQLYPTGWDLACHIQDYAESGIYEHDYFCFRGSNNSPCYVSGVVSTLTDDCMSPIDFKAIYRLLIENPEIALEYGIELSDMKNPNDSLKELDLSDNDNLSIKNDFIKFIQSSVLENMSITELQEFVVKHLDKATEGQKEALLKILLK